ncbi:ABC transporter ATP-binding protein [Streptomyces sp. NPDC086549]|uniref:ATP-binding cassette domain-containing protein n=1 Tax=Streptomyces sp. NPDC086549 TaxID=3365752 RepID=UPI00381AC862
MTPPWRTRVALAPALGKRPDLLLMDDPMAQAAEHGTMIVMASHTVAELEDSCDHLLPVGDGRMRLTGEIDDPPAAHTLVSAAADTSDLAPHTVASRVTGRRLGAPIRPAGPLPAH